MSLNEGDATLASLSSHIKIALRIGAGEHSAVTPKLDPVAIGFKIGAAQNR
jgi:hypothetical protein